jgi:hypothetical protein
VFEFVNPTRSDRHYGAQRGLARLDEALRRAPITSERTRTPLHDEETSQQVGSGSKHRRMDANFVEAGVTRPCPSQCRGPSKAISTCKWLQDIGGLEVEIVPTKGAYNSS